MRQGVLCGCHMCLPPKTERKQRQQQKEERGREMTLLAAAAGGREISIQAGIKTGNKVTPMLTGLLNLREEILLLLESLGSTVRLLSLMTRDVPDRPEMKCYPRSSGKGPSINDVMLGRKVSKHDNSTDRLRDWESDRESPKMW